MSVIVYSTPNCQQCRATKKRLKDLGIPFEAIDLADPAFHQHATRFLADGLKAAPVVEVVDDSRDVVTARWEGYRPDLLGKHVVVTAAGDFVREA